MNNSTQAQKGFKTFLLTLSVSLIVFSAIYYLLTNTAATVDSLPEDVTSEAPATEQLADSSADTATGSSVFSQLSAQAMDVPGKAVLAGATTSPSQTTQSTTSVPSTGLVGITVGLIMSLVMFLAAMYVIVRDPRRLALLSFEKKTVRGL